MVSNFKEIAKITTDTLKNLSADINITGAVIYGSWVKGMQDADSDIDILVVSDTINPHRHRRGKEIAKIKVQLPISIPVDILLLTPDETKSNFKNHNPLFLDIAVEGIVLIDRNDFLKSLINETKEYILNRKLEKLIDGWRFPVLYREPTFLSRVSNKDFAIAMITDAERDFDIANKLIENGYFDKAVYHFQQAVEKSIKAVLITVGEFKKTHYVGKVLLDRLQAMQFDNNWQERLTNIAKIATEIEPEVTWSRYPGIDSGSLWIPYEEYNKEDAVNIRNQSEEVMVVAKDFIKWWFKL